MIQFHVFQKISLENEPIAVEMQISYLKYIGMLYKLTLFVVDFGEVSLYNIPKLLFMSRTNSFVYFVGE